MTVRGPSYPGYMDLEDLERAMRAGGDPRELARLLREGSTTRPAADGPAWRRKLGPALHVPEQRRYRPVALLFELISPPYDRRRSQALAVRPLTVSASGNWVRSELGWPDFFSSYRRSDIDPAIDEAMRSLYVQASPGYGYVQDWMMLRDADGATFWDLLDELRALGVELRHGARTSPPVVLEPARITPFVDVVGVRGGVELTPAFLRDGQPVPFEHYALVGGDDVHGIYTLTGDATTPRAARWARLIRFDRAADAAFLAVHAEQGITVPRADLPLFMDDVLPTLSATNLVRSSGGAVAVPAPPVPTLVVGVRADESGLEVTSAWEYTLPGHLTARVGFAARPSDGVMRDLERERRIGADVAALMPDGEIARELRLSGLAAADFVARTLPAIGRIENVRVETRPDLPAYRTAESAPIVTVGTTATGERDWFDLQVAVTVDGREVPFDRLFVALADHADVVVLDDGTYFPLDGEAFAPLRTLIEEARALSDRAGGTMRISAHQGDLWNELVDLAHVTQQADQWRSALDRIRRFDDAAPAVPTGLRAELRDYQREGFVWLERLRRAGLGGILADDMGLGKTVQVLAMFLAARRTDAAPHLVVAPTSVVGNWVSEATRFAPDLKVVAIESLRRRRGGATIAELTAGADVVVTSYGLLRLEAEEYAAVAWQTTVLDEAQAVKNPDTKTYRAIRALPADARFVVTGTPLENTLMDLWALLGVAAPGLFPRRDRFTDFYRTPIEREGDAERLALLHRRLRPFMLRRTKGEVASELPERIEQIIEVELEPRHRRLYDTHLQRERQRVLGLLDDVQANRFEIFRSLTLLRRLALDPALVDDRHEGIESAKLAMLRDLLTTIVADGHRTLVFSQFTGYLRRARQMLDAAGITYEYLDGSTTRRPDVIRRFREGTASVFLISLKAGGSGLTLTEADYCVLLDPWWNPAVEQQAIDRAHRIGQTRNVMVYRLVSAHTIEDKVMSLKADKSRLFDSVISGAALSDARLTAADIRDLLSDGVGEADPGDGGRAPRSSAA